MSKRHVEEYPEFGELGVFAGYGENDCGHTIIVSISPTECQCTGCLRIWPKEPGFKSDYPDLYGE